MYMRHYKSLDEAWREIVAFNDAYFPHWRTVADIYWSNALAGEVGELCNATKKRAGGGTKGDLITDGQLIQELADVFIYWMLTVEKINGPPTDFLRALSLKMDENERRMKLRGPTEIRA